MVVTRWAPLPINQFPEFRGFRRPRPLSAFSPFYGRPAPAPRGDWAIPVDVERGEGRFTITANLPGFAPDDISVAIDDGVLTIQAGQGQAGRRPAEAERTEGDFIVRERRAGVFRRSLRLPEEVDADQSQSTSEHGVLTVTLPLAEARQPRQLKVAAPATG